MKGMRKGSPFRIRCILLLCVCCLSPVFLLTGCGSGTSVETENGREFVIGFSQLGSESAWRLGNTASMESAAADHGFSLMLKNGMQKQDRCDPLIYRLSGGCDRVCPYR